MYKLMVVDDEKIVIDSVNFIVKSKFNNVKVVAGVRNGTDAIEQFVKHKPDIVLMDICMPGMNGLEAISEMSQIMPSSRFVVISAYEQFEFAKQAVELEVKEYLLKPVNALRLTETISKLTAELDLEHSKARKSIETKERFDQAVKILEHWLIFSVLLGKDPSTELKKYCDLVGIKETFGYSMIINFGCHEKVKNKFGINQRTAEDKICLVLNDLLRAGKHCLMGPSTQNRITIYVFSKSYDEEECKQQSILFAQNILKELRKVCSLDFSVGIGRVKENALMMESYEEARRALRNASSDVMHYMDRQAKGEQQSFVSADDWQLLNHLEFGELDEIEEILDNIIDSQIGKNCSQGFDDNCRNKLIELMVVAHRLALELNVDEDSELKFDTYLNEMLNISDSSELRTWCKSRLIKLASKIQAVRETNSSRIVQDAKELIENKYNSDISLESAANELGISPHYLSKLFKKETKINFIDYLTRLRLTKAKEYLKEGGKSIKEICFLVGYTDPNYFSRLFKKHTDHSPTEFIKGV